MCSCCCRVRQSPDAAAQSSDTSDETSSLEGWLDDGDTASLDNWQHFATAAAPNHRSDSNGAAMNSAPDALPISAPVVTMQQSGSSHRSAVAVQVWLGMLVVLIVLPLGDCVMQEHDTARILVICSSRCGAPMPSSRTTAWWSMHFATEGG